LRYECHDAWATDPPVESGVIPLNVQFCVDHQVYGSHPGDDKNALNDCFSGVRTLIVHQPQKRHSCLPAHVGWQAGIHKEEIT
jgi:hypothetical protein